jgi:Uma2 family endonuclease
MKSMLAKEDRAIYGKPPGFRTRMTAEEFDEWYSRSSETVHAEWSKGKVELIMPENALHNNIIFLLAELIRRFSRRKTPGTVFGEEVQIRLAGVRRKHARAALDGRSHRRPRDGHRACIRRLAAL